MPRRSLLKGIVGVAGAGLAARLMSSTALADSCSLEANRCPYFEGSCITDYKSYWRDPNWNLRDNYDYVDVSRFNLLDFGSGKSDMALVLVCFDTNLQDLGNWTYRLPVTKAINVAGTLVPTTFNGYIYFQVTSVSGNGIRIYFDPDAGTTGGDINKIYGPIVSQQLAFIRANSTQEPVVNKATGPGFVGYQIELAETTFNVLLNQEEGEAFSTISLSFLSVTSGRLPLIPSLNVVTGESSQGSRWVGCTFADADPVNTSHYGLGELYHYDPGDQDYRHDGQSKFARNGQFLTCYNYDNLWYNQPELFPPTIPDPEGGNMQKPCEPQNSNPRRKGSYYIPQYLNAPFTLSRLGANSFYGMFLDNPAQSFFNFGDTNFLDNTDPNLRFVGAVRGELDLHLIWGATARTVMDTFTYLMGHEYMGEDPSTYPDGNVALPRAAMIPRYLLGVFQAHYGYTGITYGERPLTEVVDGYAANELPLEGLGIDIDVQENHQVFTINPNFMTGADKDISVFEWGHGQNLVCQTNITAFLRIPDPGQAYECFDALKASEAYVKRESEKEGIIFPQCGDNPNLPADAYQAYLNYGKGDSAISIMPDFGDPAAATVWGDCYRTLLEKGLDFIWQDMTVPAAAPHMINANDASADQPPRAFGEPVLAGAPGDCPDLGPNPICYLTFGTPAGEEPNALNPNAMANMFSWRSYHGQLMLTDPRWQTDEDEPLLKSPFVALHNFHSYMLARSSYEKGLLAHKDQMQFQRSFIICRGGYPGIHQYAGHWIGDNASTWFHLQIMLPQSLNLQLAGVAMVGADVGGFAPGETHNPYFYNRLGGGSEVPSTTCDVEPELFLRWVQAACLMPWFRIHSDLFKKNGQTPFAPTYQVPVPGNSDYTYTEAMKIFLELRYRWHQLLYDGMYRFASAGTPPVEPMVMWEASEDANLVANLGDYGMSQQFLIGDQQIIVSPVLHEMSDPAGTIDVEIYLPHGLNWWAYSAATDTVLDQVILGGVFWIASAGQIDLPILIRDGAIIPEFLDYQDDGVVPVRNINSLSANLSEERPFVRPSTINIFAFQSSGEASSEYTIYADDDGRTRLAETQGQFSLYTVHHYMESFNPNHAIINMVVKQSAGGVWVYDQFLRIRMPVSEQYTVVIDGLDKDISYVESLSDFVLKISSGSVVIWRSGSNIVTGASQAEHVVYIPSFQGNAVITYEPPT